MKNLLLAAGKECAEFLIEESAFSGVKKIVGKVVNDFNEITGFNAAPGCVSLENLFPTKNVSHNGISSEFAKENLGKVNTKILFATVGQSEILTYLSEKSLIDLKDVKDKWEVYGEYLVTIPETETNLYVIAGSDKLGTIYGAFSLSEKMGVSPLKYWADATLPTIDTNENDFTVSVNETYISKEPSVKFRGFFINDEWPCYGNWTFNHFGGFTAKMYDNVFELLLRLKGNYLWPAMWTSSFALDGPGLLSYELADEYGIYIGNSHHEPCLRAGEEYSKVRGKDSIYGDAWNFHTNTEGITRFWRDSMNERGGFTSIVTVGMRGEADSKILGENATLKDNIDLLKKVIVCQNQIIKETEEKYNKKFPKMLALYKEVEPFYYGDANTEGLCEWDELDDTILMLCEDNHGYTRTLPDDVIRSHKGGFGMYYHVDYHGDPISYEWINSTPLTKIWEQMSQAYDYGIRDLWILNVGDLKHNEFPLSYFLNLAYDFDKWGTNSPNKTFEYTKEAVDLLFGKKLTDELVNEASEILTENVRILATRRPEALNSKVYDPSHFGEADNMLTRLENQVSREAEFTKKLAPELKDTWYSLAGFQVKAGMNLVKMMLSAGKNELLALEGRKKANEYADIVSNTIHRDDAIKQEFAKFKNGKWAGMELAPHVGFIKWNEDGNRYPIRMTVEPVNHPRMFVLRNDDEKVYDKQYGAPMNVLVDDFLYAGTDSVDLVIANTGIGELTYEIQGDIPKWLTVSPLSSVVSSEQIVTLKCDKESLTESVEEVKLLITDKDTKVTVSVFAKAGKKVKSGTNFATPYGFSIPATWYESVSLPGMDEVSFPEGAPKKDIELVEISDYGIYGSAVKFYPTLVKYEKGNEPSINYEIYVEKAGTYTVDLASAPVNPLNRMAHLEVGLKVNDENAEYKNIVPAGFRSGEGSDPEWARGTLTHRRNTKFTVNLKEGINKITVLNPDPGYVLLKLFIYEKTPKASYLGIPSGIKA